MAGKKNRLSRSLPRLAPTSGAAPSRKREESKIDPGLPANLLRSLAADDFRDHAARTAQRGALTIELSARLRQARAFRSSVGADSTGYGAAVALDALTQVGARFSALAEVMALVRAVLEPAVFAPEAGMVDADGVSGSEGPEAKPPQALDALLHRETWKMRAAEAEARTAALRGGAVALQGKIAAIRASQQDMMQAGGQQRQAQRRKSSGTALWGRLRQNMHDGLLSRLDEADSELRGLVVGAGAEGSDAVEQALVLFHQMGDSARVRCLRRAVQQSPQLAASLAVEALEAAPAWRALEAVLSALATRPDVPSGEMVAACKTLFAHPAVSLAQRMAFARELAFGTTPRVEGGAAEVAEAEDSEEPEARVKRFLAACSPAERSAVWDASMAATLESARAEAEDTQRAEDGGGGRGVAATAVVDAATVLLRGLPLGLCASVVKRVVADQDVDSGLTEVMGKQGRRRASVHTDNVAGRALAASLVRRKRLTDAVWSGSLRSERIEAIQHAVGWVDAEGRAEVVQRLGLGMNAEQIGSAVNDFAATLAADGRRVLVVDLFAALSPQDRDAATTAIVTESNPAIRSELARACTAGLTAQGRALVVRAAADTAAGDAEALAALVRGEDGEESPLARMARAAEATVRAACAAVAVDAPGDAREVAREFVDGLSARGRQRTVQEIVRHAGGQRSAAQPGAGLSRRDSMHGFAGDATGVEARLEVLRAMVEAMSVGSRTATMELLEKAMAEHKVALAEAAKRKTAAAKEALGHDSD